MNTLNTLANVANMETCDRGVIENDDWADTDYDEELSQVMLSGGIYIAPLDTARLCGSCTALLNLVWDAESQKDACGAAAS